MGDRGAPTYRQLLAEAQEIGRVDGRFAAAFEGPAAATWSSPRCLGRTPAEFARLLWGDRPDPVPSGLESNAPLWYATGFAEGLAENAVRSAADARPVFT